MARAPTFDLAAELGKPSFTPAVRDAPALVELVVEGDERAPGALAKLAGAASAAIAARIDSVDEAARARLVGALGKLGETDAVIARMTDASPRVRRAAAGALGKLGGDAARAALLARWEAHDVTPDERRTLVEALGKVAARHTRRGDAAGASGDAGAGGDEILARLRALDPGDDAELARRRDRALLMIGRDSRRDDESRVAIDVPPPAPVTVRLHCKPGLAGLLAEDFPGAKLHGDAAIDFVLAGAWARLHESRLWISAGIRIAMRGDLVDTIVSVRPLLAAWTRGPIRWRLGFASGHRRGTVWRVARDVTARAPELVNDPTQTAWDILVDEDERALELVPRRADDPRFAWRVAEVPAASHPTVAAALARVAGAHDGERVWDPFAGSGAELIERARLGPCRLFGSDLDERALAAARENLAAAGITAELARADARTHAPGPVELIVTNPPLGSRVRGDAGALLAEALPHFARQLAPGGRLVWITPAPRRTSPVAERAGLRRTRELAIDLGGVRGVLERWEK
jgi:SAM-dependent methyltransferase